MKKQSADRPTGRTVGAFFDLPGQYDYPFNGDFYITVYTQLEQDIRARGGQLLILRSQESYLGKNMFSGAWRFEGRSLVAVPGPIHIDIIWNKGRLMTAPGDAVVNDPALDALCTDKWKTYELFPEQHPRTCLLTSAKDIPACLPTMRTPMVVAKPIDAEGGAGVFIASAEAIVAKIPSFPYLLQEFIDTSKGIDGIVDGMHDFRVLSLRGDISLCYIRTPPPKEMTANVSRGGREIEVPPDRVPAGALELFRSIDAKLTHFVNRVYTVDMGLDRDGQWKLFELNSKPGFSPKETGPSYSVFYGKLAEFLLTV